MILHFLLACLLLAGCAALHSPDQGSSHVMQFEAKEPVRIALVLGGGGSKGLAHLGAIQELEKAGIRPDLIVGCSAGAIIGAFYADSPDLSHAEKLFLDLKKSDLLDTSFFGSRFGVVQGKKLRSFMDKNLSAQTFTDLKIPLIVVATDLFNGETVELSQGELSSAVHASSALPGLFKPVVLHGKHLIDGGITSPLPVEVARKYGAQIVIAIDVSEELPSAKPKHMFGVAKRGIEISYRKLIAHSLEKADVAIKMSFQDIGMFSEHLKSEMFKEGQKQARNRLPEIHKKIAELKSVK